MSNLVIEVLSANVQQKLNKIGKPYEVLDLAFKNKSFNDKVEGKQIMSFAEKAAFETLKDAINGQVFTVTRAKDDKGYWKWNSVTAGQGVIAKEGATVFGVASAPSPARTSPKSTYETPEERAARQVMIVRQSSISSAVALAASNSKAKVTPQEIIETAKVFEAYVFGKDATGMDEVPAEMSAMGSILGLEDDIPE